MKVSRSGYYDWLDRLESSRSFENKELTKLIREIFTKSRNIYGTRRIADQLAKRDIFISRNRIGKLMALAGLFCKTKRKFRATTNSKHNKLIQKIPRDNKK
jgi:transposase InsO family protein